MPSPLFRVWGCIKFPSKVAQINTYSLSFGSTTFHNQLIPLTKPHYMPQDKLKLAENELPSKITNARKSPYLTFKRYCLK